MSTLPTDRPTDGSPELSIIVPTFREFEALPHLLDRLAELRRSRDISFEVIIADDDSQDGTEAMIAEKDLPWVQLLVRKENHGLSPAVLDGLALARGNTLLVMDADLSHPPEAIPAMLKALADGADFVIGSRYTDGGTTADDWGLVRGINSRVATVLARPLTSVADPMAGFFALRRDTFEHAKDPDPVGYKIALELLVRSGAKRIVEIPIHFSDRAHGESKLTLSQQLLYIKHLRRLYIFKYGIWSHLTQFLMVGALGTFVNLGALTAGLRVSMTERHALLLGIATSICFNFLLNRRFTFSYARAEAILKQFVGFVAASFAGAVVTYSVTLALREKVPQLSIQLAAVFGIVCGSILNFMFNRFLVFRAKHIRPESS